MRYFFAIFIAITVLAVVFTLFVVADIVITNMQYIYEEVNSTFSKMPYAPSEVPSVAGDVLNTVTPILVYVAPIVIIAVIVIVLMYSRRY